MRRTIALYLSDTEQLIITSSDPELAAGLGADADLLGRAAALISTEYPNPFGGGSSSAGSWNLHINVAQARKSRGVRTLTDYFERQMQILADMHPQADAGPTRASVIGVGDHALAEHIREALGVTSLTKRDVRFCLVQAPDHQTGW